MARIAASMTEARRARQQACLHASVRAADGDDDRPFDSGFGIMPNPLARIGVSDMLGGEQEFTTFRVVGSANPEKRNVETIGERGEKETPRRRQLEYRTVQVDSGGPTRGFQREQHGA